MTEKQSMDRVSRLRQLGFTAKVEQGHYKGRGPRTYGIRVDYDARQFCCGAQGQAMHFVETFTEEAIKHD